MSNGDWIERYAAGPDELRRAVDAMTDEQRRARPVAGRWSTHEVVCHLADFEPIYADRMKRVIAETEPTFFGGDPDLFAASLAYDQRETSIELDLIAAVRSQMARILRSLSEEYFTRIGNHSEAGPVTLAVLLQRITDHIPHHVAFVAEKRRALGL